MTKMNRLYVHSEKAEFRFYWKPLDNVIGLCARVLPETISGVLIKILLSAVNLNKATHTLGEQLNS